MPTSSSCRVEPGCLLVAYTHGVSESRNVADEEWGEEAVLDAIRSARDLAPERLAVQLLDRAQAFAGEAPQHDDMTIVAARITPPAVG